MNRGNRHDLLADEARAILDRQLRECGGDRLVQLEHRLRLFNLLMELEQTGHILPGSLVLVESAQLLRDAVSEYDLAPVALFRSVNEKA